MVYVGIARPQTIGYNRTVRVASTFPDALCWKPLGLPEDFLPLLAPGRRAFVLDGQRTVAHGGITLEEMVVPFVHIVEGKQ